MSMSGVSPTASSLRFGRSIRMGLPLGGGVCRAAHHDFGERIFKQVARIVDGIVENGGENGKWQGDSQAKGGCQQRFPDAGGQKCGIGTTNALTDALKGDNHAKHRAQQARTEEPMPQ